MPWGHSKTNEMTLFSLLVCKSVEHISSWGLLREAKAQISLEVEEATKNGAEALFLIEVHTNKVVAIHHTESPPVPPRL